LSLGALSSYKIIYIFGDPKPENETDRKLMVWSRCGSARGEWNTTGRGLTLHSDT